ncbi:TYDP2 phosphodiesterase, partial [Amia calva]|nr:TYDP2 phosphodiesterase [Amia calva]
SPDVVFLQELIPPYLHFLKKHFKQYTIIEGNTKGYFTGIMLKTSRVTLLKSEIVKYPTTEMGRNLLMAQVQFCGIELCLMTSHLESCKGNSQERVNQLRRVFKRLKEAPDSVTVIFGGDTNLRDWEVGKLGGLPTGVCDVWEYLGKLEVCRYTWDNKINDNKDTSYCARLRFDRIFLRPAKEGAQIAPQHMDLIGLERLPCGRFTSDHWGLHCGFTVQTQTSPATTALH